MLVLFVRAPSDQTSPLYTTVLLVAEMVNFIPSVYSLANAQDIRATVLTRFQKGSPQHF